MLHDPARHEPLAAAAWDEAAARAWIVRCADDAQRTFTPAGLWPVHPSDADGDDAGQPFTMIYFGAAGVIWALESLSRAGVVAPAAAFAAHLPDIAARNRALVEPWGHGVKGMFMGQSGIELLRFRLATDRATQAAAADAIAASIAANANHPSLEMLWGAPSTMHVALTMHEWTGDARWAELFAADAHALLRTLLPAEHAACRVWTQDLYGQQVQLLGAGHGFAGNASALVRGRALLPVAVVRDAEDAIVATLHATALREGPLANWRARLGPPGTPDKKLVQWCHGAPGIVTSVARLPDPRLDDLLIAAGELTWTAGPLAKGSGLCHGTAGNGYAFLKLFRRTGDARWLERARAFAMHAMAQSDRMAAVHGMRRYSLWTGDPGVACYLWSCIRGDDTMPNLDAAAPV